MGKVEKVDKSDEGREKEQDDISQAQCKPDHCLRRRYVGRRCLRLQGRNRFRCLQHAIGGLRELCGRQGLVQELDQRRPRERRICVVTQSRDSR